MTAEEIEKIIKKNEKTKEYKAFLKMCKTGKLYYKNENDIKRKNRKLRNNPHPLKVSDNRISLNWHGLFVDQKSGYMFGKEPNIDIGDEEINQKITNILGDEWGKILKQLVIEASNCGLSWIHYWIDENNKFEYGKVSSEQIIPVYSTDLKERLTAIIRKYEVEEENIKYTKIEYWDKDNCYFYKCINGVYSDFYIDEPNKINSFQHPHGRVPFIYFNNNMLKKYDLYMYKDLIDKLDESISDFANDIDDVQEIIFILEGYGGEQLAEFMRDLKVFKAVKVDKDGDVRTIKAEIPTEARKELFKELKEALFLFGMGVNPNKEGLGDSSGVALKFLYSLLELKASITRTEFDCSIKVLIRAILNHLNDTSNRNISITYYKNMITNDKEIVDILSKSENMLSNKTKTKNHPYVENIDEELKEIKNQDTDNDYDESFGADKVE